MKGVTLLLLVVGAVVVDSSAFHRPLDDLPAFKPTKRERAAYKRFAGHAHCHSAPGTVYGYRARNVTSHVGGHFGNVYVVSDDKDATQFLKVAHTIQLSEELREYAKAKHGEDAYESLARGNFEISVSEFPYLSSLALEREVDYQMRASSAVLSPQILESFLCKDSTVILMEHVVDAVDLGSFLEDPSVEGSRKIDALVQAQRSLDTVLVMFGIWHNDGHCQNFLVHQKNGRDAIKLIDFGQSFTGFPRSAFRNFPKTTGSTSDVLVKANDLYCPTAMVPLTGNAYLRFYPRLLESSISSWETSAHAADILNKRIANIQDLATSYAHDTYFMNAETRENIREYLADRLVLIAGLV